MNASTVCLTIFTLVWLCRCTLRAALKTIKSKDSLPHPPVPASSAVDSPIASHAETSALKAARSEAPAESALEPSAQAAAARSEPANEQLEDEPAPMAAMSTSAEEGDLFQRHGTGGSQCADTDADTQLQKKDVIEGLLQGTAPWPDMDYQQLATDAGLQHSVSKAGLCSVSLTALQCCVAAACSAQAFVVTLLSQCPTPYTISI